MNNIHYKIDSVLDNMRLDVQRATWLPRDDKKPIDHDLGYRIGHGLSGKVHENTRMVHPIVTDSIQQRMNKEEREQREKLRS